MRAIAATPGALRLFGLSIVARLPLAALGIGLLVHARHLTGSFAAAGVVAGALSVGVAGGQPLLGRLVDRRGQTLVLLGSAAVCAAALVGAASLPASAPIPALVALALVAGLATPPLGACLRTLWPTLLPDADHVRAAYALEAGTLEITYISGPPLVLGLGAIWSTAGAIAVSGVVLLLGTVAFASAPASRAWRPAPRSAGPRRGALRAPGMRTLSLVLLGVGALLGAVEVAVPAATDAHGSAAAAGPLLGLWGAGSLVAGLVAARGGGGARTAGGLVLVLVAMAAGHLALAPVTGSVVALAAVLVLAGGAIAPMFATVYGMVDGVTPPGTATEAFAWLSTAISIGVAAGAAGAGGLVELAGPEAGFAAGAACGALAADVAWARRRTLEPVVAAPARPVPSDACASGATAASPSPSATVTATP